ncbi:MAG: hypothetical protein LBU88_05275, partial [Treponema sp.]|nr:hypothetical protein [Treponema sp.]
MPVKIKLKHQVLILLIGLAFAAGSVFLLNFILAGPKLGKHYDFLLNLRQPPPVSGEILIIDTGDYIENNDLFTVLLALTEMEAEALVMTGNLSPLSSPVTVTESEVRRRFMDEYNIIGSNIRNLFQAIRMGTVSPINAPEYVEKLVELTEHGKDRLLAALIDRDEDFLLSIAVFGNYMEADHVKKTDKDGKLRRVQPVNTDTYEEHPVYTYLKDRYAYSMIETIEKSKILWLKKTYSDGEDEEIDIRLDDNANIITPWNCSFRGIDISLFREYEEAGRSIKKALEEADVRGAFSKTLPERSPLFLGEYALMAREDMLKSPTAENIQFWKNARAEYFISLDEFLSGQAEALLVRGYEEVIEDETSLSDEGLAALAGMRDGLTQFFVYLREEYEVFTATYSKLNNELSSAFCILGPSGNTEYSALLANALITKSHVKPVANNYVLLWSFIAVLITLIAVFWLKPLPGLFSGFGLSFIFTFVMGCIFIYYLVWLDPLIIFVSSITGTLVIFSCKCFYIKFRTDLFRTSYGAAVPPNILKRLILEGKPHPKETSQSSAAVIAIKDVNLLHREDREKPQDAGKIRKNFLSAVKRSVFNAGGVI